MTTVCEIVTLADGGRLHISQGADTAAVLLLGHGAGGGIDVTDLAWLAEDLPGRGLTVVRHEQPWRVRGGRVAWPPARLDACWAPAVRAVADRWAGVPLVAGGRSAGARVACRGSVDPPLLRNLWFLFSRRMGDRRAWHPFGTPGELAAVLPPGWAERNRLVVMPGAGHSLIPAARAMPRSEVRGRLAEAVASFVVEAAQGDSRE